MIYETCIFCGDVLKEEGRCSCGECLVVKAKCSCRANLYVELSTMVPRCTNSLCEVGHEDVFKKKVI